MRLKEQRTGSPTLESGQGMIIFNFKSWCALKGLVRAGQCSMITRRVIQTRNVIGNTQTQISHSTAALILYVSKELGPHLTFTWRVLETVSNCWWGWRWGRPPSTRPVRRKGRASPTPGTVYSTSGRQLWGGRQGPRRAAISAYWRGWWERAWSKRRDDH